MHHGGSREVLKGNQTRRYNSTAQSPKCRRLQRNAGARRVQQTSSEANRLTSSGQRRSDVKFKTISSRKSPRQAKGPRVRRQTGMFLQCLSTAGLTPVTQNEDRKGTIKHEQRPPRHATPRRTSSRFSAAASTLRTRRVADFTNQSEKLTSLKT